MLRLTALGAIASLLLLGFAWAQEPVLSSDTAPDMAAAPTADAYGYTADEVAVNQAVVAYWYAHGYANCYGCFPTKWADLAAKDLPLRKFMSPHTGDEIDLDDGVLDFDGDMIFVPAQCWDVQIKVKTTQGEVVIPGWVSGKSDLSVQFGPCCQRCLSTGCADVTICGIDNWGKCGSCGPCGQPAPCNDCVCKMVQWMLWNSFELHEKLFGTRPADELAWYASGLAPFDKNYKELAPFMDVEFIYKGNCTCSLLKKAYVHCCQPCSPCESKCNSCAKPKCGGCEKPSCNSCAKPKCGGCEKPSCNSCAKPKCGSCQKPSCNSCAKPKCGSCQKPSCSTCKPKCESKAPCGKCSKCSQKTCTKPGCGSTKPKCGSCSH